MNRQQMIAQIAQEIIEEQVITKPKLEEKLRRLITFTEVQTDPAVEFSLDPLNTSVLRWCRMLGNEARVENVQDLLIAYTGIDGSKAMYCTREEQLDPLIKMVKEWPE